MAPGTKAGGGKGGAGGLVKRRKRRAGPDALATLEDVSRAVGASTATVSRALNDLPGVGAKLRRKVLAAVKDLGYVPRAAARTLSRSRSDTLGVAFQDLTAGWLLNVFRGIVSRTIGRYHLITMLSIREGDEFELPHRLLAERRVDGLLWLDMRATPAMIREMKKQPVPFVVLNQQLRDADVNTVSMDAMHGGREAVRHLLRLGCRKLLFITGPAGVGDSIRKLDGARQALAEAKVRIPPENILEGHHVGALAVEALSKHLARHPLPEAIFCFNDDMALAALHWLRQRGTRVPEDVAVVGYDGIEEAERSGLTTIETPMRDMGVLAAQLLIEQIEGPPAERKARQVVLQGRLRIRDTCGARLRGAAS